MLVSDGVHLPHPSAIYRTEAAHSFASAQFPARHSNRPQHTLYRALTTWLPGFICCRWSETKCRHTHSKPFPYDDLPSGIIRNRFTWLSKQVDCCGGGLGMLCLQGLKIPNAPSGFNSIKVKCLIELVDFE